MNEITLKDVLDVVIEMKQEMNEKFNRLEAKYDMLVKKYENLETKYENIETKYDALFEENKKIEKIQQEILFEQEGVREFAQIIKEKIGSIDKEIYELKNDKCIFHKTLVKAKDN